MSGVSFLIFGATRAGPCFVTEGAVVGAGVILVAGEVAVWTEGGLIEIVAIAVETILGVVFVPFDVIVGGEFFGLLPGERFDLDELDVRGKIRTMNNIVADFVEQN